MIEWREKHLWPNHEDTLEAKNNNAVTLQNLGRHEEAEKLLLEVIQGWEKLHGHSHESTLRTKSNYARTLDDLK